MESMQEALDRTILRLMEAYDRTEATRLAQWVFEDCYSYTQKKLLRPFEHGQDLESIIKRLLNHEPVQYVTGMAHFYGLVLKVNQHVLIPRPETEELVQWILTDYRGDRRQLDCLDIGTGSGCIAVTLKKHMLNWRVFGMEYSLDALNVTRINARKLGAPIELLRMNFLDKTMWDHIGMLDVIVSNPPYVTEEERGIMSDNVLLYEPEMALFAKGDDALVFYRNIHELAQEHLRPAGRIYLEINEFKAEEIRNIFTSERISEVELKHDMQGKPRMLRVTMKENKKT